ncbi:ribosome maturation protein SDO1 [Nematocida sp. LUAm3]|nr:ribosome maturation protein SDO1 [Nematocida sp. LUAm3]KAI5175397.1 ribosome maturation protein SDO1 [Nematocida sp. LUAm2]KAI5177646.1 ribosome maturation protein SDO1 [Nematocida sp. LUAm1]
MFLPNNKKKIENITVVVYRGKRRNLEIAAIPNKLYEYKRKQDMLISEVVPTFAIFSDFGRGKLASKEEILQELGVHGEEAVRKILNFGAEKGDTATRELLQENMKKSVKDGVLTRLRGKNRELISSSEADELLRKTGYTVSSKSVKLQINEVIKKALKLGYKRRVMEILVKPGKDTYVDWKEIEETLPDGSFFQKKDKSIVISDDMYGAVCRYAEEHNIELEDVSDEKKAAPIIL